MEAPFEGEIVLNDPIVNDGDDLVAADVRMGIGVGGGAVGRPTGMADTKSAGGGFALEERGELGDSARAFPDV